MPGEGSSSTLEGFSSRVGGEATQLSEYTP